MTNSCSFGTKRIVYSTRSTEDSQFNIVFRIPTALSLLTWNSLFYAPHPFTSTFCGRSCWVLFQNVSSQLCFGIVLQRLQSFVRLVFRVMPSLSFSSSLHSRFIASISFPFPVLCSLALSYTGICFAEAHVFCWPIKIGILFKLLCVWVFFQSASSQLFSDCRCVLCYKYSYYSLSALSVLAVNFVSDCRCVLCYKYSYYSLSALSVLAVNFVSDCRCVLCYKYSYYSLSALSL